MSDSIDAILSHHPRDLRKPPITSDLFFRTKALKLLFRSETRTVIALTVKWRSHVLTSGYQVEEEKNSEQPGRIRNMRLVQAFRD